MAKAFVHCLLILTLLVSGLNGNCSSCLEQTYSSQIGVREATNHNDGPQVEEYLHTVKLGRGYAWCAAFVKWCLLKCSIPNNINGMAASAVNRNNMVYKNGWLKPPLPGDVITLYSYTMKRICHTAFYNRTLTPAVIETVEGNTNEGGSRDGDGVYKRRRPLFSIFNMSRWGYE